MTSTFENHVQGASGQHTKMFVTHKKKCVGNLTQAAQQVSVRDKKRTHGHDLNSI